MPRITSLLVSIAVLCLGVVSGATADPIAINGGTIWATGLAETGPAWLTGTPSLSFKGGVVPLEGRIDPFTNCSPCFPGSSVSVGGNLSGGALPGLLTFEGAPYDVGSMSSSAALALEFAGTAVAPMLSGFPTMIIVPFTMTGNLFIGNSPTPITGKGLASILFRNQSVAENSVAWFADQVRYDFSPSTPVPEPATLTTLAFGLAALVRSAHKRRSRRS